MRARADPGAVRCSRRQCRRRALGAGPWTLLILTTAPVRGPAAYPRSWSHGSSDAVTSTWWSSRPYAGSGSARWRGPGCWVSRAGRPKRGTCSRRTWQSAGGRPSSPAPSCWRAGPTPTRRSRSPGSAWKPGTRGRWSPTRAWLLSGSGRTAEAVAVLAQHVSAHNHDVAGYLIDLGRVDDALAVLRRHTRRPSEVRDGPWQDGPPF